MTTRTRALVMLLILMVVALAISALVSVVVPAEWNNWLPVPRPGFPPPGGGRFASDSQRVEVTPGVTPQPIVTPGTTPVANERPRQGRGGGFRVFELPGATLTGFMGQVAGLLLLLSAGALALYAMPRRIGRMASTLEGGSNSLVRAVLAGLAGYIILAVLGVLLAVALLGGLTVLLLVLLLYLTALIAITIISLPLGRMVSRRFGLLAQPPIVNLLAGLLVIFIVGSIPFIGTLALILLAIAGFGAIVQTRAGSERGWDFDLDDLEY